MSPSPPGTWPDGDREWVTTRQAADYLQLHPRTIQRYARDGSIRAARVGGRLRLRREDVELLLHGQTGTETGDGIP